MRVRLLAASLLAALLAIPALAVTARDLSARIRIDGFTNDFTADESVFGFNAELGAAEEAVDDSKWGVNNDLNNIRITWDAANLYVAGEGRTWGNNMVILIDAVPERGARTQNGLVFRPDPCPTTAAVGKCAPRMESSAVPAASIAIGCAGGRVAGAVG